MKLTENTILISGGATGIGFALARQLSERGNRVIVCGRRKASLDKARSEVSAIITRTCDITSDESRRAMVDWLNANHPDLNVVINNAGVQNRRDFNQADALKNLDQEVAVNFTAHVHLIGEILPLLRRNKRALIVNVSSGLAFAPLADVPIYCASKAALHSFTLSLRHQLRPTGVRVVEMIPPIVDTGLGGGVRSAGTTGQGMMSPTEFATDALSQMENDQDEILVGMSANTRRQGEALFERMNSH
ncbi:SDR family oxidoreductase [Bradyrhizobium canariense]|uniref:SDR family oxidoreductase n=1 Tax=Bradyrhizobium canariense TaxID=255045 RepID=UPI001B8A64A6|nr:SDR family oxidoreductase [Bradyrhizobium canariense]MBR0955013.1 SDR family oxidoreductase [Bradyrhizobium canariense]